MADAKEHAVSEGNDAIESLMLKLILSQTLVGKERDIKKGRLSKFKTGIVNVTKGTFVLLLINMISRLMNYINDALKIQLFFVR